jgi:anti-sigma-K factor RskA
MNQPLAPTLPARHANLWRAATIACLLMIAIATATGMSMFEQFKAQIAHLQTKIKTTAHIKYLSVLMDEKHAPALLITFDLLDNALQVQRLNAVTEGQQDTMQLWALSPDNPPRSIGIFQTKGKTLRLPADENSLLNVSELAVSVENKGGVEPGKGPRLPYLFTGTVLQKAL